jgi:hypothetical protein
MKAGDRVICIKRLPWRGVISGDIYNGPKHNEKLIIEKVNSDGCLRFAEYPLVEGIGYMPQHFRKLDDSTSGFISTSLSKELAKEAGKVKKDEGSEEEKYLEEEKVFTTEEEF